MTEKFIYNDERFADIEMLRYPLLGFEALTLQQKLYIYCLSEATLCGRDITFDQFGRYNLVIRKTLEEQNALEKNSELKGTARRRTSSVSRPI